MIRPSLVAALAAFLTAFAQPATARPKSADEAMISGAVTYDDDVLLPADAAVDIWVLDVTPGMVAAAVVTQMTIEAGNARPPIPFKLRYDPGRVFADHDYAIKAVIRSGGETIFEMPNDFRVLTKGQPTRVDVWVKKVGVAAAAPAPVSALAGTSWRVEELAGEAVPADAEGTLEFPEAGKISGRAFCNRFSGKVEISGGSIHIGPIRATKMGCGQAATERESRFFELLYRAERFELEGSTLIVYSTGSAKPTRLTRRA